MGLGHEFLRHIERAGILVHLVEPSPVDGSDPVQNYRVIRNELNLHSADLSRRPEIVALTKCELPGAAEVQKQLAAATGAEVLAISAVTGEGLDKLMWKIDHILTESKSSNSQTATA